MFLEIAVVLILAALFCWFAGVQVLAAVFVGVGFLFAFIHWKGNHDHGSSND